MKTLLLLSMLVFSVVPLMETSHKISVYIEPTDSDGGSKIIGYYIEYKAVEDMRWKRITNVPIILPPSNIVSIRLDPDVYDIRVLCVNGLGVGSASKSKIADNREGEDGVYLICPPPPSLP